MRYAMAFIAATQATLLQLGRFCARATRTVAMRIEIPPRTTSEIWAAFLRYIAERDAVMSPRSAPALIAFVLPRPLSVEEQCWMMSQPLPDRYAEHRVDYLADGATSELSLILPVQCDEDLMSIDPAGPSRLR